MTISPTRIEVSGLTEFRVALKRAEIKTPKELTKALRSTGTNMKRAVRKKIRENLATNSRSTGRLERDLHVETVADEITITEGESTPYAGWWEFGGNSDVPPPRRDRVRGGRALYPAMREIRPDIELDMELMIAQLVAEFDLSV